MDLSEQDMLQDGSCSLSCVFLFLLFLMTEYTRRFFRQ